MCSSDLDALVGAGTLFGINGLWIIPLNADFTDCGGFPTLLSTLPGDAIDFAGSIVVPAPLPNIPKLYIRLDANAVVVYWNTNFTGYTLQSRTNLSPGTLWQTIPGPYPVSGFNFEHREPFAGLPPTKFFRLEEP